MRSPVQSWLPLLKNERLTRVSLFLFYGRGLVWDLKSFISLPSVSESPVPAHRGLLQQSPVSETASPAHSLSPSSGRWGFPRPGPGES